MKRLVTRYAMAAGLMACAVSAAKAETVKFEALVAQKEELRLDFADGSKHFFLLVHGSTTSWSALHLPYANELRPGNKPIWATGLPASGRVSHVSRSGDRYRVVNRNTHGERRHDQAAEWLGGYQYALSVRRSR